MSKAEYEEERENALWKKSIYQMFQRKDLEDLKELRDGPDSLSEENIVLINKCIEKLEKDYEKELGD